jgi:hypothetical protein
MSFAPKEEAGVVGYLEEVVEDLEFYTEFVLVTVHVCYFRVLACKYN